MDTLTVNGVIAQIGSIHGMTDRSDPAAPAAPAPAPSPAASAAPAPVPRAPSHEPERRRSLVEKVREEVMEALPTMKELPINTSDAKVHRDAAATFGAGSARNCGRQVYDPQIDKQQSELIAKLTQRVGRLKLQHKQEASSEAMATNQQTMLQSSLQMLLEDDDIGGPTSMEDRNEHDELTARLSAQLAELEDTVARHRREKDKLGTAVALAENELKQRATVRLRVTEDVERTLAGLIESHSEGTASGGE